MQQCCKCCIIFVQKYKYLYFRPFVSTTEGDCNLANITSLKLNRFIWRLIKATGKNYFIHATYNERAALYLNAQIDYLTGKAIFFKKTQLDKRERWMTGGIVCQNKSKI